MDTSVAGYAILQIVREKTGGNFVGGNQIRLVHPQREGVRPEACVVLQFDGGHFMWWVDRKSQWQTAAQRVPGVGLEPRASGPRGSGTGVIVAWTLNGNSWEPDAVAEHLAAFMRDKLAELPT